MAGIILDISLKITGILSVGKMIPESNITGIISTIPDASMAAVCVFVKVEINNPNDRATRINNIDTTISKVKLPATGTCNTKRDSSSIVPKLTQERTK